MTEAVNTAKTDEEIINEAMLSVLEGEDGDLPPVTENEKQGEDPKPEGEDVPPVESGEPEPEPEAPKPKFTEEEVLGAFETIKKLQKSLDTVNGTYGNRLAELQARINDLQQKAQQQVAAPTIAPGKLDKLKAEYPDVAELLEADLQALIVGSGPEPKFDQSQIDRLVEEKVSRIESKLAEREAQIGLRLLKREHPDFQEVAGYATNEYGIVEWNNPRFGLWVAESLSKEEQGELLRTNDAGFLSEMITKYKGSLVPAAEPEVKEEPKQKKAMLENAVRPKGAVSTNGGVGKSDEEIMLEAMLKEMNS